KGSGQSGSHLGQSEGPHCQARTLWIFEGAAHNLGGEELAHQERQDDRDVQCKVIAKAAHECDWINEEPGHQKEGRYEQRPPKESKLLSSLFVVPYLIEGQP